MKFWQPFLIASQFPLNIYKRTPLGMSFLKARKVNLTYALFESPCGLPVSNQQDKYPWTLNFCSLSGCGLVDVGFYNTSLVLKKVTCECYTFTVSGAHLGCLPINGKLLAYVL